MTDIINNLRTRPPRYEFRTDEGLRVTLQKTDSSRSPVPVTLLNISTGGAKIRTSETVQFKDAVVLRIEVEQPIRAISVSGEVCWVAPALGDKWSIGCRFDPPIPEEVLQEFAEAGVIERRENQREQVSLAATALWELKGESRSVRVLNHSRGGFCLQADDGGKPGERLLLRLEIESAYAVPARIQWKIEAQEGYVIGCSFQNPRDFGVFSKATPDELQSQGIKSCATQSSLRQIWPALAAAIIGLLSLAISGGPTRREVGPAPNEVSTRFTSTLALDPPARTIPSAALTPMYSPTAPTQSLDRTLTTEATTSPAVLPVEKQSTVAPFIENFSLEVVSPSPQALIAPEEATTPTESPIEIPAVPAGRSPLDVPKRARPTATTSSGVDPISDESTEPNEYRTWRDNTRRYQVVARLDGVEDDMVRLQKRSGKIASVPLARLSAEDIDFVQSWLAGEK